MNFPQYDKRQYRADLVEQLNTLAELAESPSTTATCDTAINAMRLCFEIRKEIYRIDHEA